MPSPFPGMNPYLEQDIAWHDFHKRFLIVGATLIGAQVWPDYIVRIDDHIYVQETDDGPRRATGRADLSLLPIGEPAPRPGGVALREAPARVRVQPPDVMREAFLQVIDRRSRRVVTVVERLSPSKKRRSGINRAQYLAKREAVLSSQTHLVEIDLLRGGVAMPGEGRPDCVYSVLASRVEERPDAGFWPIALADRLPTIPIPLGVPHDDAVLDLQGLLDRVYDEARYEYDIYDGPPTLTLTVDEAAWVREFVPGRFAGG